MEIKKYELTDETLTWYGHTLHRIKALRDFGNVRTGELGGWLEKEENLSHVGDCWVYQDAKVYDNAVVKDNAKVFDYAIVRDNAEVYGDTQVYGWGWVCDYAKVYGHARVCDDVQVFERAQVCGNARVCDHAKIYDNAKVSGNAVVCGNVEICGDAVVKETKDYAVFKNTWSSGRYFTWTRSNDMWKVGCFYGTGEELIKKAYADGELKGKCYEAIVQLQSRISELLK